MSLVVAAFVRTRTGVVWRRKTNRKAAKDAEDFAEAFFESHWDA
jgi:hypothetical protein